MTWTVRSRAFVMVAVALGAGLLGFYLSPGEKPDAPQPPEAHNAHAASEQALGRTRPHFALPDATGTKVSVSRWDDRVMVINFWATWCIPCRDEVPILIRVQAELGTRGVQVLGIALDEPERAEAFMADLGTNYPSLYGQQDAIELGKALGNVAGVLPYTVVLDRSGVIRDTHFGIVDESQLRALLKTLL
jgi:thiol-disulfide isomerase/thioredoxin